MSAHLSWMIIRNNNAFLLKKRNISKPFSTVSVFKYFFILIRVNNSIYSELNKIRFLAMNINPILINI